MQWKKSDLRLLLLKIIVKTGSFMTASVMGWLLALGYFIYDGHKRGGSMMSLMMGHIMTEKGCHSFFDVQRGSTRIH